MDQNTRLLSATNIVLGVWLMITPFLLGYSNVAMLWTSVVVGAMVVILAWMRMANPASAAWKSWTNALLGLWMTAAPFVLGAAGSKTTLWNSIIVGAAITVLGSWSAMFAPI
jgi:hypothetical protein